MFKMGVLSLPTSAERLEHELITRPDQVMIIAGSGVSLASCNNHRCASWRGLLQNGLQRCAEVSGTPESRIKPYREMLDGPDAQPDDFAAVGEFVSRELKGKVEGAFGRWLTDSIGALTKTDNGLVEAIASLGTKVATTNYDGLIESDTGLNAITWRDRALTASFFRKSSNEVLHLHGYYLQPDSIILGTRSYDEICQDEFVKTALRGVMIFGTLIFAGCGAGLEDPNFGSLLNWARSILKECQHSHFMLVRDGDADEWRERLRGLLIEPVPYGTEYSNLTTFLGDLANRVRLRRESAPLSLLTDSQTDFDARWNELETRRAMLPALDYFRSSKALAENLWNAGGRHLAAMAFSSRLLHQGQDLLIPEYIEFSFGAAEWLLDDDVPTVASRHLNEIASKTESVEFPSQFLGKFRQLRVRCTDLLGASNETLAAIADAMPLVTPEERSILLAERSEIHFLRGTFSQATMVEAGYATFEAIPRPDARHLLIERVLPTTRHILVNERIRAMKGHVRRAVRSLAKTIRLLPAGRHRDIVALGQLQAELLHLDLLHADALAVVQEVVIPHTLPLTDEERLAVEQNRVDLQFFAPNKDAFHFYNLFDQKQLVGCEWLDYYQMFVAKQYADEGKHYESAPILWQQHHRAYLYGCWRAQRMTNLLLARQCVALAELEDAVQHALFAHTDEIIDEIGNAVLSAKTVGLVERIVTRLLTFANLRRHFVGACRLLRSLADAIPDESIQAVGEWLLKRARAKCDVCLSARHLSEAWETIAALGKRFPKRLADATVTTAVNHPQWRTKHANPREFSRGRKEMVQAMTELSPVISRLTAQKLAVATLPLAIDRSQIPDYDDVVYLLSCLARRIGRESRDMLAASLYQTGKPISRSLAQVADAFGKGKVFKKNALNKMADQVAQEIRHQVQWLQPGQSAASVGEQITEFNKSMPDQTLKVFAVRLVGLYSLARYRSKLEVSAVQGLLNAILDMARNKDNFCINRCGLLHALVEFADVIPLESRGKIEKELESLARGDVEESSEYPNAAEIENPLNPFKHRMGKPEDVQAVAIIALGAVSSEHALGSERVWRLLEDALCDHRPGIRQAAYAAACPCGRRADC